MINFLTKKSHQAAGLIGFQCLLACCIVGCSLLGCGSGNGLVPFAGDVTLDGNPLPEATVVLGPITAVAAGPFMGTTDAEGKFQLSPAGQTDILGAVPGEYRLSISTLKTAPAASGDDGAKPQILAPELVPDEYRLGNMRFEVPAAGTTEAFFDITSQ